MKSMMPDAHHLTVQVISVALPRVTANVSILTANLGSGKKFLPSLVEPAAILSNN